VDENTWISPFSKALAKVMVLGVVASHDNEGLIVFRQGVTAEFYQTLRCQHVVVWLSATCPDGNYVF
jgi:hypothetical protein